MTSPLPAGATIGILGGGQLGRMLSVAAARLGFRTCILEPGADCPASHVAHRHNGLLPSVWSVQQTSPAPPVHGRASRGAV